MCLFGHAGLTRVALIYYPRYEWTVNNRRWPRDQEAKHAPPAHRGWSFLMLKTTEVEEPAGVERRRTKRVPLAFRIEVTGRDLNGAMFHDQAVTADVNENGCRFDLPRQLNPGDMVTIRLVGDAPRLSPGEGRRLFEVVWAGPSEQGWSIGASMLQTGLLWPIVFPRSQDKVSAV